MSKKKKEPWTIVHPDNSISYTSDAFAAHQINKKRGYGEFI
jgi:hypothetical protein